MQALNRTAVDGVEIEVSLAKPQGDPAQKKKFSMKQRVSAQPPYGGGDSRKC
jgi:hypothetical protein